MKTGHSSLAKTWPAARRLALATFLLLLALAVPAVRTVAHAQGAGQVQELTGTLAPGEILSYRLPNLAAGQSLYVHAQNTAGNLDPVLALVAGDQDPQALEEAYEGAIQRAIAEGRDPLIAAEQAADELFLIWDDDSGEGLAAALIYPVPAGGDYRLIIAGSLTALGAGTFGDYRLLVGLDTPEVLKAEATDTGDAIAFLDREASPPGVAVEEITGALTADKTQQFIELHDFQPDDTLYAFVEATSGDLRPAVALRNYADKPVRTANLTGQDTRGSLECLLDEGGRGYSLEIAGCCEGATTGDYRLLVGVNAPEVLTGQAVPTGRPVVKEPIPVQIGVKLQQIVEVDEQNEFFTFVGSMQMEWTDPALAFNPDDCDCVLKVYTQNNFDDFLADTGGRWPEFTLYNQQGNRWTQNRVAVIQQDGRALYFERFSTNLQVDFDFRQYPFDEQEFDIRIDAIYPEDTLYFSVLEGYSEISTEHGEDEFDIGEFETEVTSEQASTRSTTSRFTFRFGGPRHLDYYMLQIFVPILLISSVSWVTFFLKDYTGRIEVASANLLLFIAFSFSLADNYPRLGYVTLLDAVMVGIFIVNALVVIYNVWLRRMEMNGQSEQADRIDRVLDWVYPIGYVVAGVLLFWLFF
jgi:hypothetical protein